MHTPSIIASLKRCMSIFVMVSMILIDSCISVLMCRLLIDFTHLFSTSWKISLCHGILKSQRLQNSILQINKTDNINPNGSYIEAKVLNLFLLVKHGLCIGFCTLNEFLCLSKFKPSIVVSFAFVPTCSFAKLNLFLELRLLVSKFGSLECHL